jgi:hypothetical protein
MLILKPTIDLRGYARFGLDSLAKGRGEEKIEASSRPMFEVFKW